jgi:hypothetical protein
MENSQEDKMKIITGVLLILHGLISAAQAVGSFSSSEGVANPNWLNWWPTPLGKSWLLSQLGIGQSLFTIIAGVLGLASGVCIIAAGLGLFGFVIPLHWWRPLAGAGAALSLLYFAIYAHPFFAVGIGANIAILVVLLWIGWPSLNVLGS